MTNHGSNVTSAPTGEASSSRVPARRPQAILAVVAFSVFVAADDLTVVATMLRPIISDLGLVLPDGLDDAAWIVNAYLIAFVSVMPLAGRLSDVIGRRWTFVGAYLLFLAGTSLIPASVEFSNPYVWFMTGRVLSALGGGAMVPVALAVVGDVYREQKRARALGTLGAIETLGWVWGPLYGAMLVRFLSWQWQFWLNIPLAVAGLAAAWWALAEHDRPTVRPKVDWLGAALLTITLVSLNLALLGGAEIQSVSGLDELTGGGTDLRWLYGVALVAGIGFVWTQRTTASPLINPVLLRDRNLVLALLVNFVVGAGLVVAMVDVPLFINAIELNPQRAAIVAGWTLSAMTVAMTVTSYLGGRLTARSGYRWSALAGVCCSTIAFFWMGATWGATTSYPMFAAQLALLGAGFGLTIAPTTAAVVDAAPASERGAAAGLVMLVRLLGLSIGLSALTAWALHRFNELRATIELPPIGTEGFEAALLAAQEDLTAQAIAATFTAAGFVVAVGIAAAAAVRTITGETTPPDDDPGLVDGSPTVTHPTATRPARSSEMTDNRTATLDRDETTPAAGTAATDELDAAPGPEPGPSDDMAALLSKFERRSNIMIGTLAVLLVGAIVVIGLLANRVNDLEQSGGGERVAELEADLARVEAGAALYTSQIEGFQQQLLAIEPEISAGIEEAITGLREFGSSTIEFPVSIDQTLPIDTEVTIQRDVEVPISLTVPINQSFDTTITIDTPFGPIPLDVTVPVDVEVPIDEVIVIPVDETIPIQEQIEVDLDVPIAIDVGETDLAGLTESIAQGLETLQELLQGISGSPAGE